MPVLDAKALSSDPEGLALLRDVLRPAPPASRPSCYASPVPVAPAKSVTSRDMLARLSRAPSKPAAAANVSS